MFLCVGSHVTVKCSVLMCYVYLSNQVNETESRVSRETISKSLAVVVSLQFDYISWLLHLPNRSENFLQKETR